MRTAIALAALALVTGCAVVPPQAFTYDPHHPKPKATVPIEEVVALTDRVAQLQIERNEVRTRISAEQDIWARQDLYSRLHSVGSELSPLERRLATIAASR